MVATPSQDFAFYYPNPYWRDGDWIKNLVLFFDGVALLVPQYMKERVEQNDPALVVGLRQHGLLHVIEPEAAIDKATTKQLATKLSDVIASGRLDSLAGEGTAFHELSMSRLGFGGDVGLATMLFDELRARNLARASTDGVSIPIHPKVRHLVLVMLAQILRSRSLGESIELNPATDMPLMVEALGEFLVALNKSGEASTGQSGAVVTLDMNAVGADVSAIPLDEVLSFRAEHRDDLQRYRRNVRVFAAELSAMPADARDAALTSRQQELDDLSSDLKKRSRSAWKQPASFALGLLGAAWTAHNGDFFGAAVSAGAGAAAYVANAPPPLGAYSYLFRANERYPY